MEEENTGQEDTEEEDTEEEEDFEEEEGATQEVQEAGPETQKVLETGQGTATIVRQKTDETPVQTITFKPNYQRTDAIKKVLTILKGLVTEDATFEWNGNLILRQMNTSRTAMVEAEIDMGAGLNQLTEKPKTLRRFTVNISDFKRMLKDSEPTIEVSQAKLLVITPGSGFSKGIRTSTPILDDTDETIPAPKVTLDVETKLDFKDIVTELKRLSEDPDYLTFNVTDGNLTISGTNDKLQEIEYSNLKATGGNAKVGYSVGMIRAIGDGTCKVTFAQDKPMKVAKTVTTTEYQGQKSVDKLIANITVWLAPRIETD